MKIRGIHKETYDGMTGGRNNLEGMALRLSK
jgi:hypothetical protein